MNVFANCIKHQFAHHVTQFAVLASISRDENIVAPWVQQRPDERDVVIEHLNADIGKDQQIETVLSGSLEHLLMDKSPIFLRCTDHVDRQILICHGPRPLHFNEQVHRHKPRAKS